MVIEFRRRPEAEVLAAHRKAREAEPRRRVPRPINVRPIVRVGTDELLRCDIGGKVRHYLIPPVPVGVAAELMDISIRLDELREVEKPTRQQLADLWSALDRAVTLMGRNTRRLRYRARWLRGWWNRRPFLRNPYRAATPVEVGLLLGFFSRPRTTPRVRLGDRMTGR